LLAAPGVTHDLARELAEELPELLARRLPEVEWEVDVSVEERAGASGAGSDLVQIARRRMLEEGWSLVVCLTDLPLHVGRRPVTAHASFSHGVALVSVPALGAVALEDRMREAVLRLTEGLVRGKRSREQEDPDQLPDVSFPVGRAQVQEGAKVRFVAAPARGNVRLLLGMVRANRPWRLVAGLSRALVAALGTTALALASTGVWALADGMGWGRLTALSFASILATCASLILIHRLWERSPSEEARERVLLANLATALTVALGVVTLYLALFVITSITGAALIPSDVLASELSHDVGVDDYVRLTWLVSSMATVGGALGAGVESGQAVREAAYGYYPNEDEE
jgi:putative flippase GtrA